MLDRYDYKLPQDLIATRPAEPRDSSRLFVVDTQKNEIFFDVFSNVERYLPERSLLVLNDTKVVPARVVLEKETGGKVEVLFLENERRPGDLTVRGMVDRKVVLLSPLSFPNGKRLMPIKQEEHVFTFRPDFPINELSELLFRFGTTPIPHYLGESLFEERTLRERYQSIFATVPASIAAPTASLHFTPEVLSRLEAKGIDSAHVTLHVGQGTFAPIAEENFKSKKLHAEYFEIAEADAQRIRAAKEEKGQIVAVGTTAVRVLETAAAAILKGKEVSGSTEIFIFPPYEFKVATALITNFHLPRSSLMCLVQAFLEHKKSKRSLVELYERAIEEKFRFYSFGDAMLIV